MSSQGFTILVLFLSVTWAWPQSLSAAQTKLVTDSVKVDRKGEKIFLWHHGEPRPKEAPQAGPWYEWIPFEMASEYIDSTTQRPIGGGRSVTVCWFSGIPVTMDTIMVEAPVQPNKGPDSVTTEVDKDGKRYVVNWYHGEKVRTFVSEGSSKSVRPYRGRIPVRIEVTAYQQGEELVVYFTPYDKDDNPVYCSGGVQVRVIAYTDDPGLGPIPLVSEIIYEGNIAPKDFKLRRIGLVGIPKRIAIFRSNDWRRERMLYVADPIYKAFVQFSPEGLGDIIENTDQFYWR